MKVKNLIAILQTMDPDKEVYYAKKQGKSTLICPINNVRKETKYADNIFLEHKG